MNQQLPIGNRTAAGYLQNDIALQQIFLDSESALDYNQKVTYGQVIAIPVNSDGLIGQMQDNSSVMNVHLEFGPRYLVAADGTQGAEVTGAGFTALTAHIFVIVRQQIIGDRVEI